MNLLPGWLRTAIASRRAPQRRELDLADMGTAFGLDASMADEGEPPASSSRWVAAAAHGSQEHKHPRVD